MTLWTIAYQSPLSLEFPRQEYWSGLPGSGLPLPVPGHLPKSGFKPGCPALQEDSLPTEAPGKPSDYMLRYKSVSLVLSLLWKVLNIQVASRDRILLSLGRQFFTGLPLFCLSCELSFALALGSRTPFPGCLCSKQSWKIRLGKT